MIIDVHSHIIPSQLLGCRLLDIRLEERGCSLYSIRVWGLSIGPVKYDMFEPQLQIAHMKEEGIDRKILSIPPFLFGYDKDLSWTVSWAKEYNSLLAEICEAYSGYFGAFGTVPLQDAKFAIEEMRRCVEELGLDGVEIGTNVNGRDLDSEIFSVFFEEADRLGCSMLIHPNNIVPADRFSGHYMRNLVGNPLETTIAASRLLLSSFFKKYPNIRLCFSHGGGALPFILGRIAHGTNVREEFAQRDSEFLLPEGMFFDSIVYDAHTLNFVTDACGIDCVVLGSDYPFDMGISHPVGFVKSAADERKQKHILSINPKRFLGGEGKSLEQVETE